MPKYITENERIIKIPVTEQSKESFSTAQVIAIEHIAAGLFGAFYAKRMTDKPQTVAQAVLMWSFAFFIFCAGVSLFIQTVWK